MPEIDYDVPSDDLNNGLLNRLRAAVLGANDGIVSTASVVMGVAGATSNNQAIVTAGLAALVAGALSMAVGEYLSVSSQSDAEKAYIAKEKYELETMPEMELHELKREYMKQGVSEETALKVAEELSRKDALRAHLRMHFGLDPDDINSPIQAAVASLLAFSIGGLVPFLATLFASAELRIAVTVVAVFLALSLTGYLSAKVGKASKSRAVARVLIGGFTAMAITYYIGVAFGTVIS